ncbi:MAG: hypothetical protein J6C09_01515, partial [Clostridia bacterium]|nr:hypothetical protein [Clostridia bacterium]
APYGEEIFREFCRSLPKSSADFTRRGAVKGTKIYRRRAYVFDSATARQAYKALRCETLTFQKIQTAAFRSGFAQICNLWFTFSY